MPYRWENTLWANYPPPPPPCAITLKVRKMTVRPGPSAWTRHCLRATRGAKRTYVTTNLQTPHPKHNCRNRALEHNVQANFSKFWRELGGGGGPTRIGAEPRRVGELPRVGEASEHGSSGLSQFKCLDIPGEHTTVAIPRAASRLPPFLSKKQQFFPLCATDCCRLECRRYRVWSTFLFHTHCSAAAHKRCLPLSLLRCGYLGRQRHNQHTLQEIRGNISPVFWPRKEGFCLLCWCKERMLPIYLARVSSLLSVPLLVLTSCQISCWFPKLQKPLASMSSQSAQVRSPEANRTKTARFLVVAARTTNATLMPCTTEFRWDGDRYSP